MRSSWQNVLLTECILAASCSSRHAYCGVNLSSLSWQLVWKHDVALVEHKAACQAASHHGQLDSANVYATSATSCFHLSLCLCCHAHSLGTETHPSSKTCRWNFNGGCYGTALGWMTSSPGTLDFSKTWCVHFWCIIALQPTPSSQKSGHYWPEWANEASVTQQEQQHATVRLDP